MPKSALFEGFYREFTQIEKGMADSKPTTSMRCHHCAGPLSKEMETSGWTVPPLIRDSFSMVLFSSFLILPAAYIYWEI